MKINEVISETTSSGSFASVAMPLFTGKKGQAHHKAARKAVGLEGKMQMGHDADNPAYKKKVRDVYPMVRR